MIQGSHWGRYLTPNGLSVKVTVLSLCFLTAQHLHLPAVWAVWVLRNPEAGLREVVTISL